MNNDLISRSGLKKAIEELEITEELVDYDCDDVSTTGVSQYLDRPDVLDLIDNAATVEQFDDTELQRAIGYTDGYSKGRKERPQGEWIGNAFDEHHCNRCGHPALWEEEPDGYYEVQSRFCPNCGADMRKGDAE